MEVGDIGKVIKIINIDNVKVELEVKGYEVVVLIDAVYIVECVVFYVEVNCIFDDKDDKGNDGIS